MSRVNQPVLQLLPARARSVGPSAGLLEGSDGGAVFVFGLATFSYARDPAHATHPQGPWITRCQRRFTQFTRPVFPLPVAPGWNGSPWAFIRASDPAVTSDARRGGDRPLSTGPELRCRHQSTLPSSSSLAVCVLMSHG